MKLVESNSERVTTMKFFSGNEPFTLTIGHRKKHKKWNGERSRKKEWERNCKVRKRALEGFSITASVPKGMQRLIKESKIARKN